MIKSSALPFRKPVCHNVLLIPTLCSFLVGGVKAMMAPKARKHLSANALLGLLRTGFADIAEHRPGKPDIRTLTPQENISYANTRCCKI
jgi:hypothetical protein